MPRPFHLFVLLTLVLLPSAGSEAAPIFIEAESFTPSSDGWKVTENPQTRGASGVTGLNGATGDPNSTARAEVNIPESGKYRVWVRHATHSRFRGPFQLAVNRGPQLVDFKVFDLEPREDVKDWEYVWDYLDVEVDPGKIDLILSKHQQKNCSGYVRNVDCVLITTDKEAAPDHSPYGPQTWMRVTLAPDVYEKPLHVHIFADHYRSPWYGHWHLSKAGANPGLRPETDQLLDGGEQTPWCNITPMIYQDSGAILNISARYTYHERADRLKATFEFATAPEESAIVRTMEVDSQPNGLVVVMPPNLLTEENLGRFKRDREFAEATGKIADAYDWPDYGKKPYQIPFFVSATVGGYGTEVDQSIQDREWRTLDYFGFSNRDRPFLHGKIWRAKNGSFCEPDVEVMKKNAAIYAKEFFDSGQKAEDVVFCMLTDEPTGQPSAFMAESESYQSAFRAWLKKLGKTPADLLVADWDAVKPVPETARDEFPGLHYFTQRFRTRALGDFMATQREILEKAYGHSLPTLVNFSDGATYSANFYSQGVDYFELLDADDQNAIWSEDWANGSSSYQCGAYNVDLMRAAARERGQTLGHYLIAHANRKPWDIKLKAAGETARGVRIWKNFSYGVSWGSHEGGPAWKSHTWYNHPEKWRANAEVTREIGGVEDLLVEAEAKPAEVAILYSSSTDAWTVKRNHAYGFNRMHTWMALAHAQIPVDFVAERQVERGGLDGYQVCYLSGPNLTRAGAEKLAAWVKAGGTLFLSAGAAARDEFNRPLDTLEAIMPAKREPAVEHQVFLNSGSYVYILNAAGTVKAGETELEVLSVSQKQTPKPGVDVQVLATTADGSPAIILGTAGKGKVYSAGFLPALTYIKEALVARRALAASQETPAAEQGENPTPALGISGTVKIETAASTTRLNRSYNPWEFSAAVRDVILQPVRAAKIEPPLTCNVPLVDAVLLHSEKGLVIPLANYTLAPLEKVAFSVRVDRSPDRPIDRVESVRHGPLVFGREEAGIVEFSLPLEASDYVKLYYR